MGVETYAEEGVYGLGTCLEGAEEGGGGGLVGHCVIDVMGGGAPTRTAVRLRDTRLRSLPPFLHYPLQVNARLNFPLHTHLFNIKGETI